MGSNVPHCSSLEILWPVSPAVKRGCRFACLCRLAEFRQNSALGHWLMVAPEAARPPPPRPAPQSSSFLPQLPSPPKSPALWRHSWSPCTTKGVFFNSDPCSELAVAPQCSREKRRSPWPAGHYAA